MKKTKGNIEINCDSCAYPLRKDCFKCPNCGYDNVHTNGENAIIKNITEEKISKNTSLRCFDLDMNERNIDEFIEYSKKRKYFKIDKKANNILVLRELKINATLKDNDIVIENGSAIFRIKIN